MSTLEAAIVYSVVLLFICFLIVAPADFVVRTSYEVREGLIELHEYSEDSDIIDSFDVEETCGSNISSEKLCTMLTGLSEAFRIIYEGVGDILSE